MLLLFAKIKYFFASIIILAILAGCDLFGNSPMDFINSRLVPAVPSLSITVQSWFIDQPTEASSTGWYRFLPTESEALITVQLKNPEGITPALSVLNRDAAGGITAELISLTEVRIRIAAPVLGDKYRLVLKMTALNGDYSDYELPPFVCNTELMPPVSVWISNSYVNWNMAQTELTHPGISTAAVRIAYQNISRLEVPEVATAWNPASISQTSNIPAILLDSRAVYARVTVVDECGFSAGAESEGWRIIAVATAADLAKIGTDPDYPLSGRYELNTDINIINQWTPIGGGAGKFTGALYGNGNTITLIDGFVTAVEHSGFFGYTDGASIQDLTVALNFDAALSTSVGKNIGLVAGYANNTEFKNITVTGSPITVNGTGGVLISIGGIVGHLVSGTISECASTVTINATNGNEQIYAGGIAGSNENGIIKDSYTTGNVRGHSVYSSFNNVFVGGIAGHNNGEINSCYAAGEIVAETETGGSYVARAGGIAGDNKKLHNCAALNIKVSGGLNGTDVHRIVGYHASDELGNNIAYTGMLINGMPVSSASASEPHGADTPGSDLKLRSTYETGLGWDFTGIWKMIGAYPYPVLQWQTAVPYIDPLNIIP